MNLTGQGEKKMNLGKKIKNLRLRKSVTQEELAEYLHISAQAISKWENDITTPDIQILPALSAFFGVTIDELFEVEAETHLERIENMIMAERVLTKVDYNYAERYLKDTLEDNKHKAKCLQLLAELYNHEADVYRSQAEYYAKAALEVNPDLKDNHISLMKAQQGTAKDWNYVNHHNRITYYQQFVKTNPGYPAGYMYLLDELIADGRLKEAKKVLQDMQKVRDDSRVAMYEGELYWAEGKQEEAFRIWKDMEDKDAENWLVYAYLADRYADIARYEEAIEYNKKAFELQPSPKYADAAECMAHIYEIVGNYPEAVRAWEEYIRVLHTEWNCVEGESVDRPKREIARLKELIEI